MSRAAARPMRARRHGHREVPRALSGLDPLLARLYAARGVSNPAELELGLGRLAPVGSLAGVDAAVEALLAHRCGRILVIGDFDADGATSTALVLRCLRDFGFASVDYLVPNRFEFGYGLTPGIVRVAAQSNPALLVTVDNGISSHDGVAEAAMRGIEVLITDHHLPPAEVPPARAIVNPNVNPYAGPDVDPRASPPAPAAAFASPHLAGVGVAFYLMAALGRALERAGQPNAARIPAHYLDLVALGTVADVVPLDQNNRILVTQGLKRIRAGRCVPGITALIRQAGRDPRRIVSADLGFAAAPKLNAAGRLDDMSVGIECLLTDDAGAAARFAGALDAINDDRREIEAGMRQQAFAYVDALSDSGLPPCVCLYEPAWHQGIVGLIAARVKDRCHRPVIAFARESDGRLKGSARSVPGIHVRDLLQAVASMHPGLVERFGGHAMAAGLSLAEADLPRFSQAASAQLTRLWPEADFSGAILTDGELPNEAFCLDVARMLREAGPWGAGFPEPVFSGDFELLEQRTVGERHLKLRVRPSGGERVLDAIAFNQAGPAWRGTVRLAYRLDVNEWQGIESPQLVVEQISPLRASGGSRVAATGSC